MKVAFDRFTFDGASRELLEAGSRRHLSPKAFDLLRLLLERRPAVVTKREIHEHIWQDTFVSEANLSVVVAEIRQVLGDDSREGRFIRTVHRVGYAFSGETRDVEAPPTPPPPPDDRASALCWLESDGRSFTLHGGENIIGRDPRCDVWIDRTGVSRRHARISVTPAGASLDDLDSRNGTFVAGRPVASGHPLADGDVVDLGAVSLTFRTWEASQAAPTERIARRRP